MSIQKIQLTLAVMSCLGMAVNASYGNYGTGYNYQREYPGLNDYVAASSYKAPSYVAPSKPSISKKTEEAPNPDSRYDFGAHDDNSIGFTNHQQATVIRSGISYVEFLDAKAAQARRDLAEKAALEKAQIYNSISAKTNAPAPKAAPVDAVATPAPAPNAASASSPASSQPTWWNGKEYGKHEEALNDQKVADSLGKEYGNFVKDQQAVDYCGPNYAAHLAEQKELERRGAEAIFGKRNSNQTTLATVQPKAEAQTAPKAQPLAMGDIKPEVPVDTKGTKFKEMTGLDLEECVRAFMFLGLTNQNFTKPGIEHAVCNIGLNVGTDSVKEKVNRYNTAISASNILEKLLNNGHAQLALFEAVQELQSQKLNAAVAAQKAVDKKQAGTDDMKAADAGTDDTASTEAGSDESDTSSIADTEFDSDEESEEVKAGENSDAPAASTPVAEQPAAKATASEESTSKDKSAPASIQIQTPQNAGFFGSLIQVLSNLVQKIFG